MKQQSKLLLSLLHGAGIGALTMAGSSLFSTDALAGVSNTRHNLGATGTVVSGQNRVSDTADVCVFCHTPHSSNSITHAPLWNKNFVTAAGSYTTYASTNSSTLDAAASSGSLIAGSTSLACLSCHDGAQAIDNIINAPGSGGYNANGGGAGGVAYNWVSSSGVSATGLITNGATNLGTDLSNDHPIGIAYCGGVDTATYSNNSTANCNDGDFKPIQIGGGTGAAARYWVDTGTQDGVRQKTDMYLYTRASAGTNGGFIPSVECGSCHDPHVETKAANQVAFLRISQSSSGLCLACHVK